MNLMFVTDVFPCPPHTGGAVIAYHWGRCLSSRHRVLVFSALPAADEDGYRQLADAGMTAVGSAIPLILPRGVRHATGLAPIAMHRIRVRALLAAVQLAVKTYAPEAIVAIGAGLGVLLPYWENLPPIVFVPYDSESVNFAMRMRHGPDPIRRAYFVLEMLKWQLVEARYYPMADACVAVSDEDAAAMGRRWPEEDRERLHVIPNGVQVSHFAPLGVPESAETIVISGNMRTPDTVTSARWFLRSILPCIRRSIPGATVEIVGRDPLPALQALANEIQGVKLWGYVPDLRPHLARASVYVAPLQLGSGVKNRVLEAMAMGRPVVTTPLGVRGLKVQPGRDLIVAASEATFADAVVELLRDPLRRDTMGRAAREAILVHHSWEAIVDQVERLLHDLSIRRTHAGVKRQQSAIAVQDDRTTGGSLHHTGERPARG